MTDKTPATEAGRRLLDSPQGAALWSAILAIEAEARAIGFREGHVLAREKAAERVRALPEGDTVTGGYYNRIDRTAVLAILTEQEHGNT